jgi:hypothetical protein
MSNDTPDLDGPALWAAIRDQADQKAVSPREVIRSMAEASLKDWHNQLAKEFQSGLRQELANTRPEDRKPLEAFRTGEWQDSLYEQDFEVRKKAAAIEVIDLREDLARLQSPNAHYSAAATRFSPQHLKYDAQLLSLHQLDLKRIHAPHGENPSKPEVRLRGHIQRDEIKTLQTLELSNLKSRHHAETAHLASRLQNQADMAKSRAHNLAASLKKLRDAHRTHDHSGTDKDRER